MNDAEMIDWLDYLRFCGMDEEAIKVAYREWLIRLCHDRNWVNDSGDIIQVRLAEFFRVSRQAVANWLNGTTCISSKVVAETICPALNLQPSQFWEQMQAIHAELNNIVILQGDVAQSYKDSAPRVSVSADEVYAFFQALPASQRTQFKARFLSALADELT